MTKKTLLIYCVECGGTMEHDITDLLEYIIHALLKEEESTEVLE